MWGRSRWSREADATDRVRPQGVLHRLTVFVSATDQCGHSPRYAEIVRRGRRHGLSGMTVMRGIGGFGHSGDLRQYTPFRLVQDIPLMVVVVDTPERIAAFLPVLAEIAPDNLTILDKVTTPRRPHHVS
jgi:PII-like signaling protein